MDKRKKYICVVDTETLGVDKPLVYDLGITVTDKEAHIIYQKNWIIKEIFLNQKKMETAYYYNKIPLYKEMLLKGQAQLVTWAQARAELNQILDRYNVKVIAAYNLGFDKRALTYTHKCLNNKGKFLTRFFEMWDIWGMATQTILNQKTYKKIATEQGWKTEKGNYLTNAEVAYRYIFNKLGFIEDHTALKDTETEAYILAKCLRQHKKMNKNILPQPWRICQDRA